MKRILGFGVALAFVAGVAGLVWAQTPIVPTVPLIHPTTDLVQVIPNGYPTAQNQYATPAQLNNAVQYSKTTIAGSGGSGATNGYINYTFAQAQNFMIFILPATMPYTYVYTAAAPSDGSKECFFAEGGAVTQFYFTANPAASPAQTVATQAGGTAGVSLSSNTGICVLYSASNLTWDRT